MFYGVAPENREKLRLVLGELKEIYPRQFQSDMLITVDRCMGFVLDDKFMGVVAKNATNSQEKSLVWRLHTLVWAARHCANYPGDFVECGVYKGFCSNVIIDYLNFSKNHDDKVFYLYDTYAGIPDGYLQDSPVSDNSYKEPGLYEQVKERFKPYKNTQIIQGIVPEVFAVQEMPEKIAFLHLDMNSAKAEIGALEILFERVVPGGMIIFDDYGWFAFRAQKLAEDAFMKQYDHMILELPTGQGLLVKR